MTGSGPQRSPRPQRRPRRRPSTRALALGVLAVALVLAGVVSYYASASPDGLARVATDLGFSGSERSHATGDGPFAGYTTHGVGSDRLAGGIAGVVGVLVVLLLAGGLTWALRRRRTDASAEADREDERAG